MANYDATDDGESLPSLPKALTSRSPLSWLTLFGPGAVVASVTIGTGELIFSTRGGVLFGYNILFLFLFISMLKWVLVFGTSKHLLLTGVHPFRRMMDLPGPRGWLPMMLLLMICVVQPTWMSFHSSTLGNYVALLTGTTDSLFGGAQFMWALLLVGLVVALCFSGGYTFMERIQIVVVVALMVAAIVSLVMYDPDYFEMMRGFVTPQFGDYPPWIKDKYHTVWNTPKWVELTTYVGVIGGAAFDYMAYTTWLREKRWGYAGSTPPTAGELQNIANDPSHPARRWLKAPVIDCGISFGLIVAFSAVFVASGVELLGPGKEIPDSGDMLGQQSRILTDVHPWLYPLYVSGAILTMFGTLYGTIEIGVAVVTEILRSFNPDWVKTRRQSIARVVLIWHAVFSAFVILLMFNHVFSVGRENANNVTGQQTVQLHSDTNDISDRSNSETDQRLRRKTESASRSPKEVILVVLRPVNLFTGVLACGIFCLVNLWIEMNHVPAALRSSVLIRALYVSAGLLFFGLGLKGYWDNHDPDGGVLQSRWFSMSGIVAVTVLSVIVVRPFREWMENKRG
ncbi:MAG: Nramp family divalent metal transporter [Fuerstiella sp.]|nr:Nramp family divalent metal transporter [Fuerstiella sp.]